MPQGSRSSAQRLQRHLRLRVAGPVSHSSAKRESCSVPALPKLSYGCDGASRFLMPHSWRSPQHPTGTPLSGPAPRILRVKFATLFKFIPLIKSSPNPPLPRLCSPLPLSSPRSEFALIHELCEFALTRSQKPDLIVATLTTLHAFLTWVPLGYIFESSMLDTLLKLFPAQQFRNVAVQCLSEVSGLLLFLSAALLLHTPLSEQRSGKAADLCLRIARSFVPATHNSSCDEVGVAPLRQSRDRGAAGRQQSTHQAPVCLPVLSAPAPFRLADRLA